MHVHEALERLEQIHDQLTRSEVYRGFRVPAVAAVGVLGLGAAALEPVFPGASFVWYWIGVAALCAGLGLAAALHSYLLREDEFERRRTRRVMAQFLPCLLAGAATTLGAGRMPDMVAFLPGLWAVMFGLGVIATRPHLPQGIAVVGFGYVMVGAALLLRTDPTCAPGGWAVGGVFGIGHLATALVLWRGVEPEGEGDTSG
jgi:hypothetical protein